MSAHPPTDPDYLDQMPPPSPPMETLAQWNARTCQCRDCKPGGTAHHWKPKMGPREEARCWCQPFLDYTLTITERDGESVPLPFHRPSETPYGFVFHEHGEQGPMSEDCLILTDPVLDDLDGPMGANEEGE